MSTAELPKSKKPTEVINSATVRLAGDSGDGMQITGSQLTNTSALAGNDVATFPDFPAEIRAPKGTRAGVSGFQVKFADTDIFTPGDEIDSLVAMNPAALITNIGDLRKGGLLIVNEDQFIAKEFKLAKMDTNPLEDGSLENYRLIKVPMTKLTRGAVADCGLSQKFADRCKNFFAIGMLYWLYGRELDATVRFINTKFGKKPEIADANLKALKAGWFFGETTEAFVSNYQVNPAKLGRGTYRNVMGNEALAWGLVTAAHLSDKDMFYGTYPITPASDILHYLSTFKNHNVRTFQAEDEIAAICSTIGAAFAGSMAVTTSSGPGIALKGEAMGLGMILELPMIIINVQRGGPSTGLPTKTEQSDLLQAFYGRNGESPLPIIACRSPSDCFDVAQEAWRIATKFMTPVIVLSDGYIANGAEPWLIPDVNKLPKIPVSHPGPRSDDDPPFLPYKRNEDMARPWATPGTPGLQHRIGGLEKEDITGNVCYDPDNHQKMTDIRQAKVDLVADSIPLQEVSGETSGDLLVLSWGGTYGSCATAVTQAQTEGKSVSHAHLRWLSPFPKNLGELLGNFKNVLLPELNMGQLRTLIQAKYLVETIPYNKVMGKPFTTTELVAKINDILG
ncbi:MAG: 2-oxoglutarate ferredoxin oxidoreductase subunit alpha [Pirellulaceae bacterium]|jgi:2-oxoglutarate ferredoxin oxidoreductase subunit alpha